VKVLIDECLSPDLATLAGGAAILSRRMSRGSVWPREDWVCLQPDHQQPAAFAGWLRS